MKHYDKQMCCTCFTKRMGDVDGKENTRSEKNEAQNFFLFRDIIFRVGQYLLLLDMQYVSAIPPLKISSSQPITL